MELASIAGNPNVATDAGGAAAPAAVASRQNPQSKIPSFWDDPIGWLEGEASAVYNSVVQEGEALPAQTQQAVQSVEGTIETVVVTAGRTAWTDLGGIFHSAEYAIEHPIETYHAVVNGTYSAALSGANEFDRVLINNHSEDIGNGIQRQWNGIRNGYMAAQANGTLPQYFGSALGHGLVLFATVATDTEELEGAEAVGEVGVAEGAGAVGATARVEMEATGEAEAASVWHVTTSPEAAEDIMQNGVNPARLNPESRFGAAFYIGEQPETAMAEVVGNGGTPAAVVRFEVDADSLNALDLTDSQVAEEWGYKGGPITDATRQIGEDAKAAGYNAIRYNSEQAEGGTNLAILSDFNKILRPVEQTQVAP